MLTDRLKMFYSSFIESVFQQWGVSVSSSVISATERRRTSCVRCWGKMLQGCLKSQRSTNEFNTEHIKYSSWFFMRSSEVFIWLFVILMFNSFLWTGAIRVQRFHSAEFVAFWVSCLCFCLWQVAVSGAGGCTTLKTCNKCLSHTNRQAWSMQQRIFSLKQKIREKQGKKVRKYQLNILEEVLWPLWFPPPAAFHHSGSSLSLKLF